MRPAGCPLPAASACTHDAASVSYYVEPDLYTPKGLASSLVFHWLTRPHFLNHSIHLPSSQYSGSPGDYRFLLQKKLLRSPPAPTSDVHLSTGLPLTCKPCYQSCLEVIARYEGTLDVVHLQPAPDESASYNCPNFRPPKFCDLFFNRTSRYALASIPRSLVP